MIFWLSLCLVDRMPAHVIQASCSACHLSTEHHVTHLNGLSGQAVLLGQCFSEQRILERCLPHGLALRLVARGKMCFGLMAQY